MSVRANQGRVCSELQNVSMLAEDGCVFSSITDVTHTSHVNRPTSLSTAFNPLFRPSTIFVMRDLYNNHNRSSAPSIRRDAMFEEKKVLHPLHQQQVDALSHVIV